MNIVSDLTEIRQMISEIQKSTAATAEAMSWVKTGLVETRDALQSHVDDDRTRLGKLERRQSWLSGASAIIGLLLGGFIDHFSLK